MQDKAIKDVCNGLLRVQELLDQGEPQDALDLLDHLCEHPAAPRSLHMKWVRAVVYDHFERFEESLALLREVLEADPLCLAFNRSREVVLHRVHAALQQASANYPGDKEVGRLYKLLLGQGAATTSDHIAAARWFLSKHNGRKALELVQAVTLLEPTSAEAWGLTAEAAMLLGDSVLEAQARTEAAALGGRTMAVPAVTMAPAEA